MPRQEGYDASIDLVSHQSQGVKVASRHPDIRNGHQEIKVWF
jgi:hypothetical protein